MLSGLKILDLTSNLPGPYATMLLADLGAEVLKIERPPLGDPTRQTFAVQGSDSPHYQAVNRAKKSLTLNLRSQAGREIFFELVAEYDIVIEGFRPGVMDRMGLGYQTLAARQPKLIYLALTGFGQNGPWRDKAGHDLTYLALAGVDGLNGLASGELSLPAIQVADLGGGSAMALFGLLAAVVNRQQTGQGRFIDVAMFDGVLSWLSFSGAGVIAGLEEDRPGGMWSTGRWPCYNLYPTADGRWMALGALEPHFWANFCRAVDREDLLDKAFAGPEVVQELRRLFAGQSQAEWVDLLKDHDCCCEPVLRVKEALDLEQFKAREMVHWVEAQGQRYFQAACPVKFQGFSPAPPQPARSPGQDTTEVLTGLGYSADDIERLKEEGIT